MLINIMFYVYFERSPLHPQNMEKQNTNHLTFPDVFVEQMLEIAWSPLLVDRNSDIGAVAEVHCSRDVTYFYVGFCRLSYNMTS